MIILSRIRNLSSVHSVLKQYNLSKGIHGKILIRNVSSFKETFKFSELEITLLGAAQQKSKPDPKSLVFGRDFSDHMFEVEWNSGKGWGTPRICQLHDILLHPASKVFHYAPAVFEGLKAYRSVDGKVQLFRPMLNVKRLLRSSERLVLPLFDAEEFLKCMKKLVCIDQEWAPNAELASLYVRPTYIGIESSLGVASSNRALLYIICSPVGSYFSTGVREAVSLYAEPHYVRAWPGGIGDKKAGANYAPTVYVQVEAAKKNLQQVLWLYGEDHQLTEVGTMNIFVLLINENGEKELVTPPLNGIILPGIVRQSLLDVVRKWNEFKVSERIITMKEVISAVNEGRLLEMFGSGTACVICPVRSISYSGTKINIPVSSGKHLINERLFKTLTDIQYGRISSPWMEPVD